MNYENYVIKTVEGRAMAGMFTPITSFEKAQDYAKSMVFTAQLPEVRDVNIFGVTTEGELEFVLGVGKCN
jgi:hypothetical protein